MVVSAVFASAMALFSGAAESLVGVGLGTATRDGPANCQSSLQLLLCFHSIIQSIHYCNQNAFYPRQDETSFGSSQNYVCV